jgi:hypothetical protein
LSGAVFAFFVLVSVVEPSSRALFSKFNLLITLSSFLP